ncbi:MAG TPA: RHS repeat-associated core domain-containing protein [Chitinophagaceae bacterium]|nr:RHS repeat-associated core domain-containing protein [Chitinophagaceae bacterium]
MTGKAVKVIGGVTLYSMFLYDSKGRVIQVQSQNITGGTDIITTQYSWSGQPLVTIQRQQKNGTNAQEHIVITKTNYDDLGRVVSITKAVNSTVNGTNISKPEQVIVQNEYDALGQLKQKKLGVAPLETMNYDYNIRGWLLGANRDFAKDGNNNNWFGFDLGYDKSNNGIIDNQTYTNPQYNGNIEWIVWKSKGDGEKRKYDFYYDQVNRFLRADFSQYTSGTFNQNAGVNFNVKMGDGINSSLAYDANGNILQMQQWGLKVTGSTQIDNLAYTYQSNSNKLAKVTDAVSDPNTKLGDFHDGNNGTTDDYSYDVNGNLSLDNNKAISSITYNYFNLPSVITVTGKGTISYTYDASGNKLQKITSETNATVPYNGLNYTSNITTTTTYLGGFVYESKAYSNSSLSSLQYTDKLQFVSHEEGRIRPIFDLNNNISGFAYDYFLKDHLGNVRMVLTEEQKQDFYPAATLEGDINNSNTAVGYEKQFYNINSSYIVDQSQASGIPAYQNNNGISNPYPTGNSGNTNVNNNSTKLYQLNSGTNKTGLDIALKVMAGDKIDIFGKSYYYQNNTGGSGVNSAPAILDLLNGLIGAPTGATAGGHTSATELNGISSVTTPINSFIGDPSRNDLNYSQRPKAFINYVLFDEQFRYVSADFSAVSSTPGLKDHHADLQNISVTENGYLYIYVSNESPVNVFFDNLQVVHTRGPLIEDNSYYPFGLTMSGISSKALNFGSPANKYKFNGIMQNNDFDLNMYDAFYRNLDPQIGRFWQIDPKPNEMVSSYYVMMNNPIRFSDPLGDTTWVYNRNGTFCGVVNDKLKNQVHYIKTDGDPGKPFDASGLSKKDAKALGKAFRDASFAFVGSKTVADMKSIVGKSVDAKVEIAFVGVIGKDKEIRLNALPIEKGNQRDQVASGQQIDANYTPDQQQSLVLEGHTHIAAYLGGLENT